MKRDAKTERKTGVPGGLVLTAGVATAAVLVMPLSWSAYADTSATANAPKLSMDQAQKIAQSTFNIPGNYVIQSQSYNDSPYGNQPASYAFGFRDDNPTDKATYINVTVDANSGAILNYNRPPANQHFEFPVPVDATRAQQIANNMAQKLYPNEFGQTKIQPLQPQFGSLQGATIYTYNFERYVNQLPAPFDGISISVDQDGNVTSVREHWTNLSFPAASKAIGTDQANQVYAKSLHLHLMYNQVWHPDAKPTPELMYALDDPSTPGWWDQSYSGRTGVGRPVIDATTGNQIDATGATVSSNPYQAPQPVVPGGPSLPLNPPKVNWSEQQSFSFAVKTLGIPSDASLIGINQWQNPNSDATWNFNWTTSNENISASVDATHGTIASYSVNAKQPPGQDGSGSKTVTQDQINAAVADFVKKLFVNDTGGIAIVPTSFAKPVPPANGLQSNFQLETLIDGIPSTIQSGSVNVNPQTGQVQSLWMNTTAVDGTLPDKSQAISVQEAQKDWMSALPLTLEYLLTNPNPGKMPQKGSGADGKPDSPQVILAYAPQMSMGGGTLNAVTGQFDTNGESGSTAYTGPIKDLGGSDASAQIQLLVNRKLITVDSDGNVHPNQNMTNAAFVKLLVDALGTQYRYQASAGTSSAAMKVIGTVPQTSPAYKEIVVAYQLGWIPTNQPFQPDTLMTRGDAAQLVCRALGYNALLTHPDAFNFTAKDAPGIDKTQLAADALTSMLGLFPLEDGSFHAGEDVTLAQAAVAVVGTANNLGESSGIVWPK